MDKYWLLYSWIKRGKQRIRVLTALPETPITGEELRKQINSKEGKPLSLREVSRHLTSFAEKGIVECLDKDQPYSKHYVITKTGIKVKAQFAQQS